MTTYGNPVRGTLHPTSWKRPAGNHEPRLTRGFSGTHDGLDISFDRAGDPIIAAEAGVVVLAGVVPDGALDVVIDHGAERTLYGHLQSENVSVGQKVAKGQMIGKCGDSGVSFGAHLHFSVFNDQGRRRDPWPLLAQNQSAPKTLRLKPLTEINIRNAPTLNGSRYAETDAKGRIYRVADKRYLGKSATPRKYGGSVKGEKWTLPNGTTGTTWYRFELNGTRYVASGLAVVA